MSAYKKISNYFCSLCLVFLGTGLLSSCATEEEFDTNFNNKIGFRGLINENASVDTRAGGIVFNPIKSSEYAIPFYIQLETATLKRYGRYKAIPGMVGMLECTDENKDLLWLDQKNPHTFYSWTMPWQEDPYKLGDDTQIPISFDPKTYQDMGFDITKYYNCRLLEQFIGAKTDPLTYQTNGEIVEIDYQHLVSKIIVEKLQVLNTNGSLSTLTQNFTMTFFEMPQSAIFDRRPEDGSAPKVIMDENAKLGASYELLGRTELYVCPGTDFSNMHYQLRYDSGDGARITYYGDFKSVIFNREDQNLGDWDKDKLPTVLYAGEVMTLTMTMNADGTAPPPISINIANWSTKDERQGTGHPHKGLYTNGEMQDLYNKFSGSTYTDEDVDQIYEMYGDVDEDGNQVLNMYDNMNVPHRHICLPKELILDGNGYTAELINTTATIPDASGNKTKREHVAQIGCCRNIFITNGEQIIYIDENFNIYKVNPETLAMEFTGHTLDPAPLNDPEKNPEGINSYYIDYDTGEFITSTGR